MAVRLSRVSILCFGLCLGAAGFTEASAATGRSSASFGVSLRVRAPGGTASAVPAWPTPAGVTEIAATRVARFRLFTGDAAELATRYRALLAAQGYELIEERDEDRRWAARWRRGAGQCVEVLAQPVLGTDAVRIVERGRDCDG